MLRGGSRSFFAASLLLPPGVREPAAALYAFCRTADDAIDCGEDPLAALSDLRERLDRAYAGKPRPLPADLAFAEAAARFGIPRALPEALLDGFAWDAAGRRYQTLADLYAYAVRVAGSVGMMMAMLMGRAAPELLARACDLGVAMQLTNIARDVGEDARLGRLYLPLAWLLDEGIEPSAWLANPRFEAALGRVVARLLRAAEMLYERGDAGIALLPLSCRPGIRAARLLYAGIGGEIEALGFDSVSRRAVVPLRRKARLLQHALRPWRGDSRLAVEPPLAEAVFVIKAAAHRAAEPGLRPRPGWHVASRMVWVIDLFVELERRQQAAQASGGI
jgi:phytoene synthase